jgi:hypothetical protein
MDNTDTLLPSIRSKPSLDELNTFVDALNELDVPTRFEVLGTLPITMDIGVVEYIVGSVDMFSEGGNTDKGNEALQSFFERIVAYALISRDSGGEGVLDAFFTNYYTQAEELPVGVGQLYIDTLHKSVLATIRHIIADKPPSFQVNRDTKMLLNATRIRTAVRPVEYGKSKTQASIAQEALDQENKELLEYFHTMGLLRKRDVRNLVERAYASRRPGMANFLLRLEPSLRERYQVSGSGQQYSEEDLLYLLRFEPTRADLVIRRMVQEGRKDALTSRVAQVALLRQRFSLFAFLVTKVDYNERERRQVVRHIRENGLAVPSSTLNKLSNSDEAWVSGMLTEALAKNA